MTAQSIVDNYEPEAMATKEILKDCSFYPTVFQAAERVYGKARCQAEDTLKFAPLDHALEAAGLRSNRQIRIKHILSLLTYMENWDPREDQQQVGTAMPDPEAGIPDDPENPPF